VWTKVLSQTWWRHEKDGGGTSSETCNVDISMLKDI